MEANLDAAIIEEYSKLRVPADQIVADPQLSSSFCDAVNRHMGTLAAVDQATLNKRLLNLRRRGEDKGGLPRLERAYNGRGDTKPKPR